MESALEFLALKGFRKVHQLNQRYTLSVAELAEFLNEFACRETKKRSDHIEKRIKPELDLPKHRTITNQAHS